MSALSSAKNYQRGGSEVRIILVAIRRCVSLNQSQIAAHGAVQLQKIDIFEKYRLSPSKSTATLFK
jgi:molybdopterin biosynthesis enzyme